MDENNKDTERDAAVPNEDNQSANLTDGVNQAEATPQPPQSDTYSTSTVGSPSSSYNQSGQPSNGKATAGLWLGISGLVTPFIPVLQFFCWILSILAIVFGALGKKESGKGTAGIVLGVIGLVLQVLILFLAVVGILMFMNVSDTPTY